MWISLIALFSTTIVRTVPICITEKKNELSFGWFSSDDFIILISDEIISMHDMVDFYTTVCETNQKKKKTGQFSFWV